MLVRQGVRKMLGVVGDDTAFSGQKEEGVLLCPLTPENAVELRRRLPWLRPQPLGLKMAAGCGDRLGLATPGHIRAFRTVHASGAGGNLGRGSMAPIFAQQSMRENERTGRTAQQVMDDALWGVLEGGWQEPWGADADHLKSTDDIDLCLAAGYTFFTIDPGEHVDNEAHTAAWDLLQRKLDRLPWKDLDDSQEALQRRYLDEEFLVEDWMLTFDEATLARAAAKYGRAIAHTARMYRHLSGQTRYFEFEMSVDETDTPTSVEEHFFIGTELKRLGVQWVSLAPRYVGRFEKGVDYIGDLTEFEAELIKHAAIARVLGPYKLSLHSGSDKFSTYPLFARHTRGLVHLKTAGTSYLEALRALALAEPVLFREIVAYGIERYPEDRATYHVSARLSKVPEPDTLTDAELPLLLNQFDAREVLHVTFGSAIDRFGDRLLATLREQEEMYYSLLDTHFQRHLSPFLQ
jgi:hypothetical protein